MNISENYISGEYRKACADGRESFSLIIWDEDYPGAEVIDAALESANLEECSSIQWERTEAPNTGKVELLFWWDQ